jgi:hypothetical protein
MWLASLVLIATVGGGASFPEAVSELQDCLVYGKVFSTSVELGANLYSNCPLTVERKERLLIMQGRHRRVEVRVPGDPGVHDFVYRWGQNTAQIDDDIVGITFGPAGEA